MPLTATDYATITGSAASPTLIAYAVNAAAALCVRQAGPEYTEGSEWTSRWLVASRNAPRLEMPSPASAVTAVRTIHSTGTTLVDADVYLLDGRSLIPNDGWYWTQGTIEADWTAAGDSDIRTQCLVELTTLYLNYDGNSARSEGRYNRTSLDTADEEARILNRLTQGLWPTAGRLPYSTVAKVYSNRAGRLKLRPATMDGHDATKWPRNAQRQDIRTLGR